MGEALLCYTDNIQCCNDTGQWFKLGGGDVGDVNGTGDFYVTRGVGVVRLHRRNNTSPSGIYCCEVPNALSVNIRTCIDIGRLFVICVNDFHMPIFACSFTATHYTKW